MKTIYRASLLALLALGLYPSCGKGGIDLSGPSPASAKTDDPDPSFVPSNDAIPNQYVVTFAPDAYTPPSDSKNGASTNAISAVAAPDGATVAASVCNDYGTSLINTFDATGSFVCNATDTQARSMSHDTRVQCVEADARVYAAGRLHTKSAKQSSIPNNWALMRIHERARDYTQSYAPVYIGRNVDAWIVDTGIWKDGGDFNASMPAIAAKQPSGQVIPTYPTGTSNGIPKSDDLCNHGTAIADIVGGQQYGVAPGVRLMAIKVLDATAQGSISTIDDGLNYIAKNLAKNRRAVVNLSLDKIISSQKKKDVDAMATAVGNLIKKNVVVVVAADNFKVDASTETPACITDAITVGATDAYDALGQWNSGNNGSNYGTVIDVFAPGVSVQASSFLYKTNPHSPVTATDWQGTSFAAPYVTGVVAQYLEKYPSATPADVQNWIRSNATGGVVDLSAVPAAVTAGTTTRFLYTDL